MYECRCYYCRNDKFNWPAFLVGGGIGLFVMLRFF